MRKQIKRYDFEFKRKVVGEYIKGEKTLVQISREHGISTGIIDYWRKQYEKGELVENNKDDKQRIKELEKQIERLERAYGRAMLDNELLKKKIEWESELERKREASLKQWQTKENGQPGESAK
ncbi:MAG: transposase [Candidatus Omnitrophica bacterium]|nr:transposase [Candidatus Omnitrophota bacterium]